jgi:hypothetical protein
MEQIIKANKVKLVNESTARVAGVDAREYTLARGIRFYRLQLFQLNNTAYQCLVKGKRKSIDRPEAIRFFNSIKALN